MNKKQYCLIIIALITALLLGGIYHFTSPIIETQIITQQNKTIAELLSPDDHIIKTETFELLSPTYLQMGDTQIATRAYDNAGPAYIIIKALTQGYSGRIGLILSLDTHCTIGKVEILNEHETPGLGDQYKKNEGAWLKQFSGKNLHHTHFSLKRSGGDFDAWTGATVTPQAIVLALKRVLEMCEAYHQPLFSHEAVVYAGA